MPIFAGQFATLDRAQGGACAAHPLIINPKDGSVFVQIPAGEFEMGDGKDNDCPKNGVWLDSYYIGIYCVTNRQYGRFSKETGHREPDNSRWKEAGLADHPVTDVSWEDAVAYAKWVGCVLPTEAQWEKAARGPKGLIYPWGNEWEEARCRKPSNSGSEQTAKVWPYGRGSSGSGTVQQSGNVWEWCADWYDLNAYKAAGVVRNPSGPATGANRVLRGGTWRDDDPSNFRGASRFRMIPSYRLDDGGFRLARTVS